MCANFVAASEKEKLQVGWVEKVRLIPGNIVIPAKIDTGARNSSLNAYDVEEFTRDGQKWVKFKVTNKNGDSAKFELKVARHVRVKRRSLKNRLDLKGHKRPAVMLGVCLGNVYREVEVNLADRRRFNYQMLIGRSFMKGRIVVDPSKKYTMEPKCEVEKKVE
jgi:hypothetical protein